MAILGLYTERDVEEFPPSVLNVVRSLVRCEHCSYNEINLQSAAVRIIMRPELPLVQELHPAFQEHFSEHPCWTHHVPRSDTLVHKTTDFLSQRQFQQLGIFRDFYRHLDTRVQTIFYFEDTTPDKEIGIAINRLKEFSERDRQVLACIRPHLAQALKNTVAFSNMQCRENALGETLGGLSRGLIELSLDGRIVWCQRREERISNLPIGNRINFVSVMVA